MNLNQMKSLVRARQQMDHVYSGAQQDLLKDAKEDAQTDQSFPWEHIDINPTELIRDD